MGPIPVKVRLEVKKRSGGRCEVIVGGSRCSRRAVHQHHMKKRSAGGGHTLDNLIDICYEHHDIIERYFWKYEWTKAYRVSRYKREESL